MKNRDRIDKLIAIKFDISRADADILINSGKVSYNGKTLHKTHLKINEEDLDKVFIDEKDLENLDILRDEIRDELKEENGEIKIKENNEKIRNSFNIIYEDENIIVVNKPKGLVVYSGVGKESISVVSILKDELNIKLSNMAGDERPGIVHRIDKDTSGIMVLAKNNETHEYLKEEFKERRVYKEYISLVRGNIQETKGKIDIPISRSLKDYKKMQAHKDGREAITYFEVLERFDKYTLVKVNIVTGRTHQIRVHFSQIGYPIVGDQKYSNGKNDFNLNSQLLHASVLKFKNFDGKELEFKAEIPEEFENILKRIGKRNR